MRKRYPITMMCAACIPWTKDLKFDEKQFRVQVKSQIDAGAKSIYIFGTAGEGFVPDTKVFTEIVTVFLDECKNGEGVMPMVGVISTSMIEMMDRIELARNLGAKDFQLALPCWGELSDEEVIEFFKTVCDSFPHCRFIHYNNGPRSKTLCEIDLYIKLADIVPNLVAVKYSEHNLGRIYGIVSADCPITFYLVDAGYTYGGLVGECGYLNSFFSIYPELAWEYFHAVRNRDLETIMKGDLFYKEISACFDFIERTMIDSAYDKSLERVADNNFSHSLYPPYKGLSEEEFKIVDKNMKVIIEKYKNL